MKKFLKLTSLLALILIFGCEENYTDGDSIVVTFGENPTVEFVEIEGTKVVEATVYTGNVSSSDRTYGLVVDAAATTLDPASYSVPTSVTVPGGSNVGVFEYSIIDQNIPLAGGTLVIGFDGVDPNNITYDNDDNPVVDAYSTMTVSVQYENCPPANSTQLDITFDAYPEETTWEIYSADDLENPIDAGGPYDGESSFSQFWCLESGDYVFVIFDAFGDGICCNYGDGAYSITVNGEVVVSGDVFGDSESSQFTVE